MKTEAKEAATDPLPPEIFRFLVDRLLLYHRLVADLILQEDPTAPLAPRFHPKKRAGTKTEVADESGPASRKQLKLSCLPSPQAYSGELGGPTLFTPSCQPLGGTTIRH